MTRLATLVPAYNAALHITQALDSVAAQSRLPDQIVVVDDGSRDDTAALVERWAATHPQLALKLIRQANGGASAARNAAILAADSELIAFLDADDLLEPEHHARLSAALAGHSELVAVFGQQSVFTADGEQCADFLVGKPIEEVDYRELPDGLRLLGDGLWAALVQGNFIPTSGSMTRRQAAIDAGLFDTRLKTSEDRDLWLRIARLGGFAYLPVRVARKREHDTNLTGDANRAVVNLHSLEVVQKQLDHAADLKLTDREIAAARATLERAARTLLYGASRNGLTTYLAARRQVAGVSATPPGMDPRGWLRAIASTIAPSRMG